MIECGLVSVVKNRYSNDNPPYKKHGHYMSSFFSIKGYGQSCWVVGVNILLSPGPYLKQGMTVEEIAIKCVEFLNHRPKSKYGKKRLKKPLYGIFRPKPYSAKLLDKDGKKYIQILLVTEDRKNPNFWGEGTLVLYSCRRKKTK